MSGSFMPDVGIILLPIQHTLGCPMSGGSMPDVGIILLPIQHNLGCPMLGGSMPDVGIILHTAFVIVTGFPSPNPYTRKLDH
jgi:hypothetical protein